MAHPLVLGEIEDLVTGQPLPDTHDERLRQQIARLLVEQRGFERDDLVARVEQPVAVAELSQLARIDFVASVDGRAAMVVRYAAGSIISRERPVVALARLLRPAPAPVAVITNGRDARVLDGASGKLHGEGLAAIPHKAEVRQWLARAVCLELSDRQLEAEARILIAFDALECGCGATGSPSSDS